METGLQDFPECVKFKGRMRDLCEGRGLNGRPNPSRKATDDFRADKDLPPLRQSVSQPKEWDVSQPSRGLGDVIRKVTHATGIDKAVEFVAEAVTGKKECGCKKRAEALNSAFPFKAES